MDDTRNELADLIKEKGFIKKGDFILRSGKKTNVYTDIRAIAMFCDGYYLVQEVLDWILCNKFEPSPTQIGGIATGSIPLICTVIPWFDGFYIRKEIKSYGLSKEIEGVFNPHALTVIVEDVVSTGESVKYCLDVLAKTNTPVLGVVSIIDRPNDRDSALDFGVPYHPIFTLEELL